MKAATTLTTLLLGLAACRPTIPEGRFTCELPQDCPPEMRCAIDGRCWSWGVGPFPDGAVSSDGAVPDTDAGALVDAGELPAPDGSMPPVDGGGWDGGTTSPDGGPPPRPCTLSGPEPFHLWFDGGVYCEDGSGGAYVGRGVGTTPSGDPYFGLELSACVRYTMEFPKSRGLVTFTIEPEAAVCGRAGCGSGLCGTGRFAEVFDYGSHIGAYTMADGRTTHTVMAQGEIVICRSAESQWRDQLHVVSVSCEEVP